ncbi:pyrimidine-specific ribonucleoside hydrolase RihA [Pediococcus acidilactici]|uniref:pyrimidine-specific ribonucleoside hydrolase RihA n=1 Tax=Pediococcus TaxID=1253 RepID=UPI000E5D2009|nr:MULTISPECIES: pyrimidine-specific ribonucleoside hydrolase RihA [Pediococcus]KAF0367767.1 pyrimidine-specific ribonucleoside hydrolase RihA [Pediococcus acidilactici]KAF0518365.1 pyrimidine-specific ribonucleoside hydrolase RihA [Pediococcus acidilactici]MCT3036747.1 pyrimidine-specific ribonucleoside hydrolase RihA [Pediococcus acidilactici]MDD9323854.1 pyrimidine-specific ribonucleoside hydrolase RihA [Pediococcus acidilactici]QAT21255.1 pyrimidine-specific ribonucleoside hydrolase RihA [
MTKIILDCDPGHDDALAMMLAIASSNIDLTAVTTSAGNQTPEKTLNNALRLLTLMGQENIPVAGGNHVPLVKTLETAGNVHGKSGLDGATLPEPVITPSSLTAIELMAKTIENSEEPITLVVTGPMTNAALFLRVYPELFHKLDKVIYMGGAMGLGNWTPSVEFNIFVDPEAAKIVMNAGVPLVMAPLNVTHKAQILKSEIEEINKIDNEVAHAFHGLLNFFEKYHETPKWGFKGAPLHDPCTIAWLINPQMFKSKLMNVDVELQGKLTTGETVCDYYELTNKPKNTEVLLDIDRKKFIQLIMNSLKTFSE